MITHKTDVFLNKKGQRFTATMWAGAGCLVVELHNLESGERKLCKIPVFHKPGVVVAPTFRGVGKDATGYASGNYGYIESLISFLNERCWSFWGERIVKVCLWNYTKKDLGTILNH